MDPTSSTLSTTTQEVLADEKVNPISINYIEFKVSNIAKTKQFYKHLGWSYIDYSPTYTEFNSGSIKGGFEQISPKEQISSKEHMSTIDNNNNTSIHGYGGCGGGALIILYSHNLEDTLQCIKQAGGIITQDIFTFPGGKRFHFKDLDGYELAIWSHL